MLHVMMDRCENCGDEYERLLSEEDDRSSVAEDHRDERPLHLRQRPIDSGRCVAYGFGHVFNDITAAIWFSYTMVFMQNVVGVPAAIAGFLLFFGQTVDAIATPIVGIIVDKFGKKKNWVLLGTVIEAISFPLIYYVWNLSIVVITLIYICAILTFQMAWALVQISHLSLIPELTDLSLERGKLTSIRYVFTVSTNILMFIIAWLVFRGVRKNGNMGSLIGPNDSEKFQVIFTIGSMISIFGSLLVFFNPNNELTYHYLCLAAVCFGSGSAVTSVLSLSVTANLIGNDTDCGAFIYSSVTFSDKLINGLVIIGIEFMKCTDSEKCSHYYRDVLAFSSGSLALIGLLVFLTMPIRLIKATKSSSSHIVI